MWKSYVLLSLMVLVRRKFFTFASLFGIAFALLVVMVIFTMTENFVHPKGPEKLEVDLLRIKFAYLANPQRDSNSTSSLGFQLVKNYLLPLKTPKAIALHTSDSLARAFNKRALKRLALKATDDVFFRMLKFHFLEGRPYSFREAQQGIRLCVINHTSAQRFFGREPAVGKELNLNGRTFQVIGVVEDVSITADAAYSEIWVPLFSLSTAEEMGDLQGTLNVLLLPATGSDIPAIKAEVSAAAARVVFTGDRYSTISLQAETRFEGISRDLLQTPLDQTSETGHFISLAVLGLILFLLLPMVNLVNLNISRIMERTAEIGVRKAFGASTLDLVTQFIFENSVLTCLGGGLALVLTPIVFWFVESSALIPYAHFHMNGRVFAFALIVTLIFAVFSGAWPAWKMARLQPAQTLKGGIS